MFAALGRFTFRVLVEGSAIIKPGGDVSCVGVKKIGIYIKDSYDFIGDQSLGYWNSGTNYGGKNMFRGSKVSNADFRAHGGGADFMVFSNIQVETITPMEFFYAP